MSHIRGKDTSIETLVRSFLFAKGLRFRKNDKRYPGHPEDCTKHAMPKSNVEFWSAKLLRNRNRDAKQHAELEAMGWRVIVVWECELGKKVREERLERLYREIMAGAGDVNDAVGDDTVGNGRLGSPDV